MNKRNYFLAIYEAKEGGYTCQFPDFDCVIDQGETLDETISNAKELLNFVVADMVESNEELPISSTGQEIKAKLFEEPFCIVPVNVYPPAKTERINITASGDKIAEITDYAKQNHLSRSELMVNAALSYIHSNG